MNINFTNTDASSSFSLVSNIPTDSLLKNSSSGGDSNSGLTTRVISISLETETPVFPDSSYISPKPTLRLPKNSSPIKLNQSIIKSVSSEEQVFPDSSYISPKVTIKSYQEPPPLKRCRAIGLTFDDKEYSSKKIKEEDCNKLEYFDEDDKEKKFVSNSVPKIKIPSDFNPDIPKNVINFLRNLNKHEFNFIMSRGYIMKAGDLHDKKIKKIVLELRNYHGIVVSKKK
jgi:hypothetical protein